MSMSFPKRFQQRALSVHLGAIVGLRLSERPNLLLFFFFVLSNIRQLWSLEPLFVQLKISFFLSLFCPLLLKQTLSWLCTFFYRSRTFLKGEQLFSFPSLVRSNRKKTSLMLGANVCTEGLQRFRFF